MSTICSYAGPTLSGIIISFSLCVDLNWPLQGMPVGTNSNAWVSAEEMPKTVHIQMGVTNRKISDFDYTTNLTAGQVIAVWGRPEAFAGTNNCFWVYLMRDQEEWMGFEAKSPHRLDFVLLMPPAGRTVAERQAKKSSDFILTNGIPYQQVTAVWGRPDFFPQTSMSYCSYQLQDFQEVWFDMNFAPPYQVVGAILIDQRSRRSVTLF